MNLFIWILELEFKNLNRLVEVGEWLVGLRWSMVGVEGVGGVVDGRWSVVKVG